MDSARLELDLEEHQLDNGLRVILAPDSRLPLVAVNLWYHVGSRHEQPGRTGLAHLFEHMLFQGSQHVETNGHFALIQQIGGVANGSTWFDRTNYYETLPSRNLDLGLWLESDRMGYLLPALTQEKLETQRQVVMNERRQRVDNQPYGRAFERLHQLLYPTPHPYHWPVLGWMDDIATASLDDCAEFFSTHYVPNNAVLTLCGDIQPASALDRVRHYFGEIQPRRRSAPTEAPTLPPDGLGTSGTTAAQREILEDEVELERIYLAFRAPGFGTEAWYSADLLTTALAGGRSSPLYVDLVRERQLAQSLSMTVLPTEMESTVALIATVRPEHRAEELEEAIWDHLQTSRHQPLASDDLDRAQNGTLSGYFHGMESLDQRADLISQLAVFTGDPTRAATDLTHYSQATPGSLCATADQIFDRDASVTVIVTPRGGES